MAFGVFSNPLNDEWYEMLLEYVASYEQFGSQPLEG